MFTVRAPQYGGPEVMTYEELPTPEPGKGQVRVRVHAAGVNFVDIYHRSGQYTTPIPVPRPNNRKMLSDISAIGR